MAPGGLYHQRDAHFQAELRAILQRMDRKLDHLANSLADRSQASARGDSVLPPVAEEEPDGTCSDPVSISRQRSPYKEGEPEVRFADEIVEQRAEQPDQEPADVNAVEHLSSLRPMVIGASRFRPRRSPTGSSVPSTRSSTRDIEALNALRAATGSLSNLGFLTQPPPPSPRSSEATMRTGRSLTSELNYRISRNSEFNHRLNRTPWFEKLWHFLTDPDSSRAAYMYNLLMNPLIVLSVLVPFMQHFDAHVVHGIWVGALEASIEVVFFIEILVRFVVCPHHTAFAKNIYNVIDMFAVLPVALRCWTGFVLPVHSEVESWTFFQDFTLGVLLGVVPLLRLLKLLRRFEKFHLILKAFKEALEALPVLLYALSVMALFFASTLYFVEPRDNIQTLPQAVWLTLVTMMTVGYGDVYPDSTAGHIVASVLMICSCLYMAIPIGIVGNAFNRVWQDRARLLLVRRTRDRLQQWGYKAADIPELFQLFDTRACGELSYNEFKRMLELMKVGLEERRISQLFETFDRDESGAIDSKEFLHEVFPKAFYDLYGDSEGAGMKPFKSTRSVGARSSSEDAEDGGEMKPRRSSVQVSRGSSDDEPEGNGGDFRPKRSLRALNENADDPDELQSPDL